MSNVEGPPDNRSIVLAAIGRASTPEVAKFDGGPSLGALTRTTVSIAPGSVLLVGVDDSKAVIRRHHPIVIGVPGMLIEQASQTTIDTLVIDSAAFDCGPWIDADDHQSRHLAEELFEAARILRSRGGQCWLLPRAAAGGSMLARLRSTATADFGDLPVAEYEEGATQSPLWTALVELVNKRFPDACHHTSLQYPAPQHSALQSDRKDAMSSPHVSSRTVRTR
ncbi:hypothetical protein [Brevibacterium sp. CSND-B09]|uniref:hypothetical protein n=1 Tax=Brevibacterium sp. CSND-B09 TaxID=3462571 RepID=UPI00406A88D4